jgi:hypothetical protein
VQLIQNEAFHGGGQTLNLELRPGTEITQINATFYEPDVFGRQYETIGMQLSGRRQLRRYRTYDSDELGGSVIFDRRFGTDWKLSGGIRNERYDVSRIRGDAPSFVWDAEGGTEVRSLVARLRWADYDRFPRPTQGARVEFFADYAPDWLGGQTSFFKAGVDARAYLPVYEDSRRRRHVLASRFRLDVGQGIDGTEDLFLSERYYLGGQRDAARLRLPRRRPDAIRQPDGRRGPPDGGRGIHLPDHLDALSGELRRDGHPAWAVLRRHWHARVFAARRVVPGAARLVGLWLALARARSICRRRPADQL